MAVKRPDIYEHNNPDLPIVDSDNVAGATKIVADQAAMLAIPVAKLKEGSKARYFNGTEWEEWELLDINDPTNISNWQRVTVDLSSKADKNGNASENFEVAPATANNHAVTLVQLQQEIADLVNGSPDLLNTFYEISQALGNDPNFAATITAALGNRLRFDVANQNLTAQQITNALTNLALLDILRYGDIDTLAKLNAILTDANLVDAAVVAAKQSISEKGQANGYASLDVDGKIPASELPSFTDDYLEYPNIGSFPATGESGKVYLALDTHIQYRWNGSVYLPITNNNNSVIWGNILGNIEFQNDLMALLNAKANTSALPVNLSDLNDDVYSPTPGFQITQNDVNQIRSAISYYIFNINKNDSAVANSTSFINLLGGTISFGVNSLSANDTVVGASYRFVSYGVANMPSSNTVDITISVFSGSITTSFTASGSNLDFIVDIALDFIGGTASARDFCFSGYIQLGSQKVLVNNSTLTANLSNSQPLAMNVRFTNAGSDLTMYKASLTRNTL